eukprot:1148464-Pyramimonas_sp.AAC.1
MDDPLVISNVDHAGHVGQAADKKNHNTFIMRFLEPNHDKGKIGVSASARCPRKQGVKSEIY